MTYKLSIIIPVYRVEMYIEECLDSVFVQLPSNVEVIIINDGSPDKSMDVIRLNYENWLIQDQIVLIEQKNAGPGAARNRGLDIARGEYIGFLDSDDILLENYFNLLLNTIDTYKTDIVEFGFQRFYELSDIVKNEYRSLYAFSGLYEMEKVRNEIFSIGVWFPSIRVYKREIFEKLRFPEGVFYEDLMTIPLIYLQDLKVYFIDQPLIGYRYNPNSTTALHTKSHLKDMYQFYMSLTKLKDTIPLEILKIRIGRSMAYFYNELGIVDLPIEDAFKDVRSIKKQWNLLKSLKFPDLLFFIFPKGYMFLDKIRLRNKKGKI